MRDDWVCGFLGLDGEGREGAEGERQDHLVGARAMRTSSPSRIVECPCPLKGLCDEREIYLQVSNGSPGSEPRWAIL